MIHPPFAIFYAGDAYSTAQKIMGRQSAGKAFMNGMARAWAEGEIKAVVPDRRAAQLMAAQLKADGHRGQLQCAVLPNTRTAEALGTLYYPAPPTQDLAASRNLRNPSAFSLMGVTHTLSSTGAMDQVANLVLPPFKPWDALICTSESARTMVLQLQEETREYWRATTGATRFADVQLPVIPLGVDVPANTRQEGDKLAARQVLGLSEGDIAFLFAGRLSFHAKANPAPAYQALQLAATAAGSARRIVCIEAGVFPNEGIKSGFLSAQRALAPDVRFVHVDGQDQQAYRQAWQAADVFISLSDNIQETFGLTPVEAMAAGLPVIISDWNGYKDTVRHGVDGLRVPTVIAPPGAGLDLALRHALGVDSYDFYIGRTSMATVVVPEQLAQAVAMLASNPSMRDQLGAAGRARAVSQFDWPVILRRYGTLADDLNRLRQAHARHGAAKLPTPWPQRADPFRRFAHFGTMTLNGDWHVRAQPGLVQRLDLLLGLPMLNYVLSAEMQPQVQIRTMADALTAQSSLTVQHLLQLMPYPSHQAVRALMWLWKFDLVHVDGALSRGVLDNT